MGLHVHVITVVCAEQGVSPSANPVREYWFRISLILYVYDGNRPPTPLFTKTKTVQSDVFIDLLGDG